MRHLAAAVMVATVAFLVPLAGAGARVLHPDDRALHGRELVTSTTPVVVHPDDRARHGREPVVTPVTVSTSREAGFDWLDAGIGAAVAIGLCLVGAGSYVLVARRRRTAFP